MADRDARPALQLADLLRRERADCLGSIGCGVDKHIVAVRLLPGAATLGAKGYADGSGARAGADLARRLPAIWRVQAYCDLENAASARVLEKAGLTRRRHAAAIHRVAQPGQRAARRATCYARVRERLAA